jgi:erythronate-4-phosphate dehydrogenase
MKVKIVADENILALENWFGRKAELILLPGRAIKATDVRDADALLVRSITRVDRALLEGSSIRFVGTATSGTDHLDRDWLQSAGIHIADAAGANANAVVEYVLSALAFLVKDEGWPLWQSKIAVVGAGQVGGALLKRLRTLGIECVACDPFNQHVTGVTYVTLKEALKADVVCLHTPLTDSDPHPTRHMIGENELEQLREHAVLINAGRGEVIDSEALYQHLLNRPTQKVILDVWESEPSPSASLLERVYLGTPHIAGYSVEAKLAASRSVLRALCEYFEVPMPTTLAPAELPVLVHDDRFGPISSPVMPIDISKDTETFAELLLRGFPIDLVSERFRRRFLKHAARNEPNAGAAVFDKMRRELAQRREFSANHLHASAFSPQVAAWLHAAGFVLQA